MSTKNSRNVLTAKSVNFENFTMNLIMTKLKSQTKMTKSISQKMTFSNCECCIFLKEIVKVKTTKKNTTFKTKMRNNAF